MSPEQSPSCRALVDALHHNQALAGSLHLLLADNSPAPHTVPAGLPADYLHDGLNPGLARRYNQALDRALASGATWLLLFDQDTLTTPDYLAELLTLSQTVPPEVAVIVPKLLMDGRILSPHPPRYREKLFPVTLASHGILSDHVRAFNSGALVRVSALQAIGGFPEDFWLDYLDHATFHRIQQAGGRIHLMHATLAHELSDARIDSIPSPARLLNRLSAEKRYYAQHGTWQERLLHRTDLLRQIVGWGRRGHFTQARLRLKALLSH